MVLKLTRDEVKMVVAFNIGISPVVLIKDGDNKIIICHGKENGKLETSWDVFFAAQPTMLVCCYPSKVRERYPWLEGTGTEVYDKEWDKQLVYRMTASERVLEIKR